MTRLVNNAGDRSFEVQFSVDHGEGALPRYSSISEEFRTEPEALQFATGALSDPVGPKQVSIIKWGHEHNMPRCLPAVRAFSLALTTYKLVGSELVAAPVNIHEPAY